MKKYLLLLASAALLLVGCAKEQLSNGVDGGMTQVSFTTSVDGGVATKAAIDGDGAGANVNRCIMEIYFQDELYKRMVETAVSGVAKFANVPVVAGKQYQILFWADCGGAEKADKYYTTTNLKTVTVAKAASLAALAAGDNDKLDAFYFADNYTVPQAGGNYDASLKRPFAQLNVITTDVGENKTVFEENLLPEKVYVSYQAANKINVATGEISKVGEVADYTYSYEADVYGAWSTVTTNHKELTLSMDYILAPKTEQGAIDVTFVTKNGGQPVMTHALANLPYKRNYRTNVKGDLLTVAGNWTATVDPIWNHPDIVKVVEVADIKSANEIINQYAETTEQLEVKFTAEPNDSGVPTGDPTSESRAILTTPVKTDASLSIEVLAQTRSLYVGDYPNEYTVANTVSANHAIVNINVPETSSIETLVINAPSKSVYINGKEVANVGTITSLDAITSQNTLIIEKDQTVETLTIHQGGLEIHGMVGTLVIDENAHDTNPVKVRTSENLSQDVFDVIYKEEGGVVEHDYIDRPNYSERKNGDKWDIVPSVCKITETGKAYGSVEDAFAVVENGQTIVMLQNDVLTKGQTITLANNDAFTLDLNGKTISISETGFDFTANHTNTALRKGVPVRFAIVVNGQGTMTICDNSADKLGRLETKDYSYSTTKTILVDGNAIVNVNNGTVAADYAAFYVVGHTEDTAAPANAPKPTLNVNGGKILGQMVGIGIKGNTATLKVTGGEIVGEEYYGVSTNGTQDWYDGGKFAIEITGGLIKSVEGAAMYLPAEGPTVITGGTLEGATGIAVKGGSLSISDNAIVKATGPFAEAHEVSSGNANTGSAIYVEDTYPNHAPFVNISGGRFSSVNNKAVEYFTNKADDAADKGKITLSGGLYSDKPAAEYVNPLYKVVDNEDPETKAIWPYTIGESAYVVRVNDTYYETWKEAAQAATNAYGSPVEDSEVEVIRSCTASDEILKSSGFIKLIVNQGVTLTSTLGNALISTNPGNTGVEITGGGNIVCSSGSTKGTLVDGGHGGVTLDNVYVKAECLARNNVPTLTIKSGKYERIGNGIFINSGCDVTINDEAIFNYDISQYAKAGKTCEEVSGMPGWYHLADLSESNAAFKVTNGDNVKYFGSTADYCKLDNSEGSGIKSSQEDGDEITLLKDIQGYFILSKNNVVLDLNGKTLSASTSYITYQDGAVCCVYGDNQTVKNGKISTLTCSNAANAIEVGCSGRPGEQKGMQPAKKVSVIDVETVIKQNANNYYSIQYSQQGASYVSQIDLSGVKFSSYYGRNILPITKDASKFVISIANGCQFYLTKFSFMSTNTKNYSNVNQYLSSNQKLTESYDQWNTVTAK